MKTNKKIHPFTAVKRNGFWVVLEINNDQRFPVVAGVYRTQHEAFQSMVALIGVWKKRRR